MGTLHQINCRYNFSAFNSSVFITSTQSVSVTRLARNLQFCAGILKCTLPEPYLPDLPLPYIRGHNPTLRLSLSLLCQYDLSLSFQPIRNYNPHCPFQTPIQNVYSPYPNTFRGLFTGTEHQSHSQPYDQCQYLCFHTFLFIKFRQSVTEFQFHVRQR